MKRLAFALLLLAIASPALAEEETADPGLAAMRAISFFEGTWEGTGWMRRGPTEPQQFRSLSSKGCTTTRRPTRSCTTRWRRSPTTPKARSIVS